MLEWPIPPEHSVLRLQRILSRFHERRRTEKYCSNRASFRIHKLVRSGSILQRRVCVISNPALPKFPLGAVQGVRDMKVRRNRSLSKPQQIHITRLRRMEASKRQPFTAAQCIAHVYAAWKPQSTNSLQQHSDVDARLLQTRYAYSVTSA